MSFDEEYNALWEWYLQKVGEYLKTPIIKGMRDGEDTVQHQKNTAEFNRRLLALKGKYGMK